MLAKDLFISYGRRESLGLVGRLHQQLKLAGYDAWFDKVNIPDGDDYAERIRHGIETAYNFVYVMAPRGLTSPYCLIELEYARILGKRVIPLNQRVIFQTDSQELAATDQAVLHGFYALHGVSDPNINTTQTVLDRSLALIGRTDWLDAKEHLSDKDCLELATWAQGYENYWHKHEDIEYLNTFEFPIFGHSTDSLASIVERLQLVLERHQPYVQQHTEILLATLTWQRHQRLTRYLLVGKERSQAEDWLLTDFLDGEQSPCQPTDLQCEFICESRKNSFNLMTHAFICYDVADQAIRNEVVRQLARQAITTWRHDQDIHQGTDFTRAIEVGIETADNFLYFLSPAAIQSSYCQQELEHALRYHKRIIPLVIASIPAADIPESIRILQHLDFTHGIQIDPLLKILHHDQAYYEQHKMLLARTLQWQQAHQQPAFLLRGHNLNNARIWLRLHQDRLEHPPTEHHRALITASEAAKGQLGTEVFISYSRKDSDFARQLNLALQAAGKTTWFDQESISSGVDFEREIFKGIEGADNFVLIISPDAVESPYCEREVNYASTQCKRFIPILWRPTTPTTLPQALRTINWLDFQNTPFEQAFPELIQTLDLDREHAHQHTVLQQRASDWVESNRSRDFLLNVTAYRHAKIWCDKALEKNKQPTPTPLQQDFIRVSQQAIAQANRRRNIGLSLVSVLAIVAVILAIVAFKKMHEAQEAKVEAEKAKIKAQVSEIKAIIEKLGAQSLLAAQLPSPSNGSYDRAVLLAIQAFREENSGLNLSNLLRVLQAKQQQKTLLYGHTAGVESVAFSLDGQILASGSEDHTVRLWDIAHQQPFGEPLIGHTAKVLSVAFSPDSRILASGSDDRTVRLWDVARQQLLGKPLIGHTAKILSVAFSPDGRILASGSDDRTVRLWDIARQQPLGEPLAGHTDVVRSVAFSPDGQTLASGSYDHTVRLWDVANRQPIGEPLAGHISRVKSIVFSPDGQTLASGSSDLTVRLWNIASQQPIGKPLAGHASGVNSVAFSPDGQILASGSSDHTVRLWDVASQQPLGEPLVGHFAMVRSITFSPDGQTLASGSWDHTVRLWEVTRRQPLGQSLAGHTDAVRSVVFSPDGQILASGSDDRTVRLWDVAHQRLLGAPLTGHTAKVWSVAFSHNGQILASGSDDRTVRLWDVARQQPLGEVLAGHSAAVLSVTFSPNGQILASGGDDRTVRLWDIAHQQPFGEPLIGHTAKVLSVAFSPDSQVLVSASDDRTVRLWEVARQQPLGEPLAGHTSGVSSIAFSPNGQILASGSSDNTVRLWDIASRQPLGEPLAGHSATVSSVAFSPNGQILASGSFDHTMRLWDVARQQPFGEPLAGHFDRIMSVVFSPVSQTLASASDDRTVRLWEVDIKSWLKQLCAIANRNLSQAEWRQYIGDRPHKKTCPDLPKDTLGALEQIKQGKKLAEMGKMAEAMIKFKSAQALDAHLVIFDIEAKAKYFAAQSLVEQGEKLAKEGKIAQAIAKYQSAQQIDATLEISAWQWNSLCRSGSLYGQAAKVLKFCEKAVALAPYNWTIRDSHVLARALTGDIPGAIEDLQLAIDKSNDEEFKKTRQGWVDALKQGKNPFTEKVLEELR